MHNDGQKHNINKKTYFMEVFENDRNRKELESLQKQCKYEKYKNEEDSDAFLI